MTVAKPSTTRVVKPSTTTLDPENAYWMARLSSVVYLRLPESDAPDESAILSNLKSEDEGFIAVKGASNNSAQAVFVEHSNYCCFAFRGTDQIADWLDNLDLVSEQTSFGEFHQGFLHSLKDVWQPLFECYKDLQNRRQTPLFLTGHSLGGAMACIATAKLWYLGTPVVSTYTFGQPRAVSKSTTGTFEKATQSKFFRFQNNNDVVTRVPAQVAGYKHVGDRIYISSKRKLTVEKRVSGTCCGTQ